MTIGWAIVGIGRHPHRWMAPAINRARDSRLVAVLSRDQGRADAFAREHGAEKGYTSLEDLLRHPGVDAVYVASPNSLHAYHTIQAARAGKHVLCEKPMALTVADCQAMIRECRRHGVLLGVGFHLRHHPGLREARRLIQEGVLGRLVTVQGEWGGGERGQEEPPPRTGLLAWWMDPQMVGGGTIMATGVHVIDLVRFLTGREVVQVTAMADNPGGSRSLEWHIHILMRLEDGTLASAVSSRRTPDPCNDVVVHGSLGRLRGEGMLGTQLGGTLEVVSEGVNTRQTYTQGDMYLNQVEAFNRCIREGGEPDASGMDGLRVCQVTVAALQSAQEGRTISLEPVGA